MYVNNLRGGLIDINEEVCQELLVRNEEAGGSNPLSSTRFQRTYIIFGNLVLLVLAANERAGKSE